MPRESDENMNKNENLSRDRSFELACASQRAALVAHAQRYTKTREAAEDIAQEAMLRALRAWPTFDASAPEANVAAWLRRIVYLVFVDTWRRATFRAACHTFRHGDVVMHALGRDEAHDEPGALALDQLGDEVTAALEALDDVHREVVERVDMRGQLYKDAASEMGIPIGTLMSRLYRARRRLGVILVQYASTTYGIEDQREMSDRRAVELADASEPAEREESEPDGVEGVVADDDAGDLLGFEAAAYTLSAW